MSGFKLANLTFHIRRDMDLDYWKVVEFDELSVSTQVMELLYSHLHLDLDRSFTWFSWSLKYI